MILIVLEILVFLFIIYLLIYSHWNRNNISLKFSSTMLCWSKLLINIQIFMMAGQTFSLPCHCTIWLVAKPFFFRATSKINDYIFSLNPVKDCIWITPRHASEASLLGEHETLPVLKPVGLVQLIYNSCRVGRRRVGSCFSPTGCTTFRNWGNSMFQSKWN